MWSIHGVYISSFFSIMLLYVDPKQKNIFNIQTILQFHFVTAHTSAADSCMWRIEQDFFFILSSQHGRKHQPANRSKIKLMILFVVLSTAVSAAVVVRIHSYFVLFIFPKISTLGEFLSLMHASRRHENRASMHMWSHKKTRTPNNNWDHFQFIVDSFSKKVKWNDHSLPTRSHTSMFVDEKIDRSCNKWKELFHLQHFPVLF